MLTLSKAEVLNIKADGIQLPSQSSFGFPERVLQFGTGVLLRGLSDYYIDKANKQDIFKGRIVVVKSTDTAGADSFGNQDGLYTLCIRGISQGKQVSKYVVNSAISRVLAASTQWSDILQVAENPNLQVVISNTTEAGIVAGNDALTDNPPSTFPGKLLSILYARYKYFNGSLDSGLVILPTELITDNGSKLKDIVYSLAKKNKLEDGFIHWLDHANDFCNTLVDRIVPGRLPAEDQKKIESQLGYKDKLMIMAEPFSLWAIETNSDRVSKVLSFARADENIVIVPSIDKFKEIKLRLLNGTHTLSCGVAICAGFKTVKEAMDEAPFRTFVEQLMLQEIGLAIQNEVISKDDIEEFSRNVIDRFSNPYLEHRWENIAMNFTAKMAMRNIPILKNWYEKSTVAPHHIACGFAAYLNFMDTEIIDGQYVRMVGGQKVILQDEFASVLFNYWKDPLTIAKNVLADARLWGEDLSIYENFVEAVTYYLKQIRNSGMHTALQVMLKN